MRIKERQRKIYSSEGKRETRSRYSFVEFRDV
jgi:hypothetical protein